ncbi:hypothetical protein OG401_21100 [Kitasatospora purpeofusca]|uniref:hypothetical protein n=1 Tax=Kitasatospora purpeofusca TaxID=67352 RepID=UPI00225BA399|nr:hypothetical protein [Kitasatospora purpeofusca]MCX4686779.1 hypothetical protein [Kitasatospora purpeofusca]
MTTSPRSRIPPVGRITRADLTALGVPAATVRSWSHRRLLGRVGGTERYPEYDAAQALALVEAWQARRKSA